MDSSWRTVRAAFDRGVGAVLGKDVLREIVPYLGPSWGLCLLAPPGQDKAWFPQILGALLDAVAHGIRMLPETQSEDWPRMADFAHWATACECALWQRGTFRDAYGSNRRNATQAAIDDDPVASAVRDLVTKEGDWEGTTSELLTKLSQLVGEPQAKAKG